MWRVDARFLAGPCLHRLDLFAVMYVCHIYKELNNNGPPASMHIEEVLMGQEAGNLSIMALDFHHLASIVIDERPV